MLINDIRRRAGSPGALGDVMKCGYLYCTKSLYINIIMRRLLCFISFFLLLSSVTFAQIVTIRGHVLDENNDPVFACAVYSSETHYTFSDSLGLYSLSVPMNKSITIHCQALGFKDHDFAITPKEDCTVDVILESDIQSIIELSSLPASCSMCGSKKVVPILYGLPSKKGWKLIKRGKYIWGGCLAGDDGDYGCVSCGQRYHISK